MILGLGVGKGAQSPSVSIGPTAGTAHVSTDPPSELRRHAHLVMAPWKENRPKPIGSGDLPVKYTPISSHLLQ